MHYGVGDERLLNLAGCRNSFVIKEFQLKAVDCEMIPSCGFP